MPLIAIAPFLEIFGIERAVALMGGDYLWVRTLSLIPLLVFLGARSYLQAKGRTASLVWGIVAANLLNVILTMWIAFGGGRLPDWTGPLRLMPAMGAVGAAIASVLCGALTQGFRVYVDHFCNFDALYGSLSTVALFLFWMFIASFILIACAFLNRTIFCPSAKSADTEQDVH